MSSALHVPRPRSPHVLISLETYMKRTIVSAAVLTLLAGGASAATALGPEPNGKNTYGLCTAYTKQAEKRGGPNEKGPNDTFTAMADAYDGEMDGNSDEFVEMCQTVLAGDGSPGNSDGKGKKGQPE